jgi:O-acetylserine/cysteine efflux transporter
VLGVAGLAVVAVGRSLVAPVLPLMIVLAAALSWAAGNIVARKAKAASGLGLVVWSGAVVPLPLLGLSLLVDGPAAVAQALVEVQPVTLLSALYTALFGSLVGYGIWNRLLGLYPSSAVVPFTLLVPVVGMTTAWLVLNEVPTPAEVTGGLLLLAGVATAVLRPWNVRPWKVRAGDVRRRERPSRAQRRGDVRAEGRAADGAADLAAAVPPAEEAGRLTPEDAARGAGTRAD